MVLASTPGELNGVDGVVLPGVGNFSTASRNIKPFKPVLVDLSGEGRPLLGICLGMQILFGESEESWGRGLNLIGGRVVRLPRGVKTPHMGWNTLEVCRWSELLDGVEEGSYFYFVHSYYAEPDDEDVVAAKTEYGVRFPSVISSGCIFGTQFHPEKSGKSGALILKNFAEILKR